MLHVQKWCDEATFLLSHMNERPEIIHVQWRVIQELCGVQTRCKCDIFGSDLSFSCIEIF